MNKLLRAGFTRLKKSNMFKILVAFTVIFAFFMIWNQYDEMKDYGVAVKTEQIMLNYATMVGVVIAVFTSLFLGVEYSDGAIRNKISIGHKRAHIYVSNLIITTSASLLSYVLFVLIVTVIGIPLFGGITMSLSKLLLRFGCILAAVIAYSSIFTFIAMIVSNKTIAAVISLLLAFGVLAAAIFCFNVLDAPKFIQEASLVNGETEISQVPNPRYPSEQKKQIMQTLLDLNPTGQMFQIAGGLSLHLAILPLYSLGIIMVFTGAGIALFRRKELK